MMQWFYNLGLAKKLTGTFLVVMSFTVILGLFSISRLAELDGSLESMASRLVPSNDLLRRLEAESSNLRTLEMRHILSQTGEERAGYEKEMGGILERVAKDAASYEAIASLPEEKQYLATFGIDSSLMKSVMIAFSCACRHARTWAVGGAACAIPAAATRTCSILRC